MARILETIIEAKRREVREREKEVSLRQMLAQAARAPKAQSLAEALRPPNAPDDGKPKLIAEIKRKSPSAGAIVENLDVTVTAQTYEQAGAAAISVLTNERFFGGSLADLTAAREATSLPILRKDFIVNPYQIFEARAAGADAVLVIVATGADQADVANYIEYAERVGMDTIVEVHTRDELTVARRAGAKIIGINNRDLQSFEVDLATTGQLTMMVPQDTIIISESGIHTADDVQKLYDSGADAILVGEALLANRVDPAMKIRELLG
ncbi:MAG: indole-3-glycerol phosphate synthase [Dehalococcoidia bacterium]|nr:indole-3-glycerol phosphate synthase [Dehalococcoidia bacterium]